MSVDFEPQRTETPLTVALSNAIVGLLREYTGRGPTRARTTIRDNVVVMMLDRPPNRRTDRSSRLVASPQPGWVVTTDDRLTTLERHMANELQGKTIAIIATDGVEQVELTEPRMAVENAGATAVLLSPETGDIQAMNSDINPADTFSVDKAIGDVSPDQYDGLILPGGTVNADRLRLEEKVVSFVQEFFRSGKPAGVICHGPWALVEADLVRDRTLTSFPSLQTDIRNAGGHWVDEEVVVDQGLVTSRNPDDLPAFCAKIIEEFAEGKHDVAAAATTA